MLYNTRFKCPVLNVWDGGGGGGNVRIVPHGCRWGNWFPYMVLGKSSHELAVKVEIGPTSIS